MKIRDLPESKNIEDRRNDPPAKQGPMSLAEALKVSDQSAPRGMAEQMTPDSCSKLAIDAGINDIAPTADDALIAAQSKRLARKRERGFSHCKHICCQIHANCCGCCEKRR